MSNQLSRSDAISMDIENDGDVSITFQKGSADRTSAGAADGLSPNQTDDSTSQMRSLKPQQFEKNFHSINAAIERIKEKIASIDEIATTGCQIENSKNADEPMNENSMDIYCKACRANKTNDQTAGLQKEVIRLKAELSAKNEKIKSLEMIFECNKTATCATCEAPFSKEKLVDLGQQVIRLKAQLSTSWEQIASLKAMLKFREDKAEAALNNLKSKYEDENTIVDETMLILRNQLRELKECTAAFSSLRAMFVTHCEESAAREDELKRQLAVAEEHRKTLTLLLRPVVHQKLSPAKKIIEKLEVAGELSKIRLQPQETA